MIKEKPMLLGFKYVPLAHLRITKEAIDYLLELVPKHYDQSIKLLGKPGAGSFLYGWQVRVNMGLHAFIDVDITASELDQLCKLCELEGAWLGSKWLKADQDGLYDSFKEILSRLNAEFKRLN